MTTNYECECECGHRLREEVCALKRKRSISWIRIILGTILIAIDPAFIFGPCALIGVALLIAGLIGEDKTRD